LACWFFVNSFHYTVLAALLYYAGFFAIKSIFIFEPPTRCYFLSGLLVGFPLGFTGVVSGFLTGSSRSPAISATVPAALTFLGLIVIYLIGKGRLHSIIAGFCVFAFSVNLMVGTVLGSASRDRHEDELTSVEVRESKADQEFKLRLYCKGLGLIADLSKPCPVGVISGKDSSPDSKP
jgi:hypothetical protein